MCINKVEGILRRDDERRKYEGEKVGREEVANKEVRGISREKIRHGEDEGR